MKHARAKLNMRFTPFKTYERFHDETDQLFLHCPEERRASSSSAASGLTALEAAWNVTNAIQVRTHCLDYTLENVLIL